MEVNREWWDGEERYIYADDLIGETPAIVTLQNLSSKIQANLSKYEGVEWDKSICPWKINYNSDFFKKQWDNCYFRDSSLVVSQSPLFKERKKGYTFYLSAAGGSASGQPHEIVNALSPMVPQYLNCLSRPDINLDNYPEYDWINDKYRCNFPVINFDYSKICTAIMIHNTNGAGHLFSENDRANWDPTGVYGISVMFFTKAASSGTASSICMGIVSLNNEIQAPAWDTTNCWNDDKMFDNGLALTWCNAWDGGFEIGGMQTLGSSYKWFQESINNPGFREDSYPSDDVAGAIYYFPIKNIPVDNPASDDPGSIWDDNWESFYAGGDYPYGIKRHLKSTITYDQFADYLKQQLAYLGFRFCIDVNHLGDDIHSEYFYIPEIDSKGVTTGNYYQANSTEAQNLPNNSWTTDVYQETPYDGTDDEEGDDPQPKPSGRILFTGDNPPTTTREIIRIKIN